LGLRGTAGIGEVILGFSIVTLPLVAYSTYLNSIPILDVQSAHQLKYLAYSVIVLTLVGISFGILGFWRFLKAFQTTDQTHARTLSVIANTLGQKRYARVMCSVTLIYGIGFAFLSGMIVYSPFENFAEEYLVRIPSSVVAVCCGSPGLIPVLTVFLTNHLGMLLIPVDIVILVSVSGLVGLNASLIVCQYDNRPRSRSGRWFLGVGAACGLFTACPTCAGLLLSTVILGFGSSALVLLSSMQLFFVLGTVLALAIGTVLSARMLAPKAGT
jgi:hypothetical protein